MFDELSIKAKEQHISLSIHAPKKKIPVLADKEKLHEVVQNLIGNALKFTPSKGTITVTVVKHSKEVEVQVKDSGPGMSKEDLGKLFQKFGMLGNSYKHASPTASGTGLGLYISKQIISMHKGKIWVESTPGAGTTFYFTLPLK